jgi:hypothetical protein
MKNYDVLAMRWDTDDRISAEPCHPSDMHIAAAICLTIVAANIHASKQPAANPSDPVRPW